MIFLVVNRMLYPFIWTGYEQEADRELLARVTFLAEQHTHTHTHFSRREPETETRSENPNQLNCN